MARSLLAIGLGLLLCFMLEAWGVATNRLRSIAMLKMPGWLVITALCAWFYAALLRDNDLPRTHLYAGLIWAGITLVALVARFVTLPSHVTVWLFTDFYGWLTLVGFIVLLAWIVAAPVVFGRIYRR